MAAWVSLTEHLEQLNFPFNFFASQKENPANFFGWTYFWHDTEAIDGILSFTFLSQSPHIRTRCLSIMKH